MRLRTYIVDAFVVGGLPGTGNAAGVVLLPSVASDPQSMTSTSNAAAETETEAATPSSPPSLDDAARQRLAAELRQTETAFVERLRGLYGNNNTFLLRWFTPTKEVPLCGHATLAAAAALVAEGVEGSREEEAEEEGAGGDSTTTYRFETVSSGLLKVRVRFPPPTSPPSPSSASAPTFELDLPSRPPTDAPPRGFRLSGPPPSESGRGPTPPPTTLLALLRALGRRRRSDGSGEQPPLQLLPRLRGVSFNAALGYLVIALDPDRESDESDESVSCEEMIKGIDPDPRELREVVLLAAEEEGDGNSGGSSGGSSVSAVVVTSLSSAAADGNGNGTTAIVSRFFAPWMGIDEDPATGSAHAVLAPLWAGELLLSREGPGSGGTSKSADAAADADADADATADADAGASASAPPPPPSSFWRARQLSERGGELSVCYLEAKQRVLVAGGAAVALEGWAHGFL